MSTEDTVLPDLQEQEANNSLKADAANSHLSEKPINVHVKR